MLVVALSIAASVIVVERATALPEVPVSTAEQYLPADGAYDVYDFHTQSGDTMLLSESQRVTGFGGLAALPQFQGALVLGALDGISTTLESTRLWRTTSRQIADIGTTSQVVTLSVVADDGIRSVLTYGGSFPAVYDPPLMVLPDDLRVGMAWSDAGTAFPEGLLTYASEGRITAVDPDRCVHVSSSLVLTMQDGTEMQRASSEERWCPGEGMVDGTTTVSLGDALQQFEYSRVSSDRDEALSGLGGFDLPAPGAAPPSPPVTGWAAAEVAVVNRDAYFGQQPLMGVMGIRPAVAADDLVLVPLASTGDVVALRMQEPGPGSTDTAPSLVEQWRAHPGGEVLSVDVFGEIVVVTTSLRGVVGYDLDGVRRWEFRTGDLVLGSPAITGDAVVVHGLDGVVHAVDVRTGRSLWTSSTSADSDLGPVVLGDRVVVADRSGALHGLDVVSGATRWTVTGTRAVAATAVGETLFVLDADSTLRAYGIDGSLRWSTEPDGWPRTLFAVGDRLAVIGDGTAALLDIADGSSVWSSGEAVDAASLGDRLVVHEGSRVCVVSEVGEVDGCIEVPPTAYGDTVYVIPGPSGVWLVESTTRVTRVGGPWTGGPA